MKSPSDPADGVRRVADGLTFVRQHPEMFRQLAHDGPSATGLLVEAVLRTSVERLEIRQARGWYSVSAGADWFADLGDLDPFTTVIPFPEFGPNAIRPEVLIAAFSDALTTVVDGRVVCVHGEEPTLEGLIPDHDLAGRTVVFKFPK